jgi:hypothetical protein
VAVGGIIAIAVRLLVPLVILRRPLLGGVLAIVADASDIVIFNVWGFPSWDYQHLDKLLDLYYLALEFGVALRWQRLSRTVASALFGWRTLGVIVFETTAWRAGLLIFANLFELYFLFVLAAARMAPGYVLSRRRTLLWLLVLLVPKLLQEYLLHIARVLDNLVLFDVIADLWPS